MLLLSGLVFDAIGLVGRDRRFHWAAALLSGSGTVLLLLAFICGIYARSGPAGPACRRTPIEWHEFVANVASWGFVLLMAWRLLIESRTGGGSLTAYTMRSGSAFYALLVPDRLPTAGSSSSATGRPLSAARRRHRPGRLHGPEHAGDPADGREPQVLGDDAPHLRVADAGPVRLAAGERRRPAEARRIEAAVGRPRPACCCGGVFLFFCADLDLYHLTDLRQLRDREVQLHKTIAVVLVVVGAMGLRRRTSNAPRPDAARLRRCDRRTRRRRTPGRRPAPNRSRVMALIGGGLLFTHVHTVAPYANVAAGVYVQHMVLGVDVALSIGAARLLQDGWPRHRRRALAIVVRRADVRRVGSADHLQRGPAVVHRLRPVQPLGHRTAGRSPRSVSSAGRADVTTTLTTGWTSTLLDRFKNEPGEAGRRRAGESARRPRDTQTVACR